MLNESFHEAAPPPAITSVTAEQFASRSPCSAEIDVLPSIELRIRSRWEYAALFGLLAASPAVLAIGWSLRTGQDLTTPFYAGEATILAIGLCLAALGLWQRSHLRSRVGAISVFVTLGCGFWGSLGAWWCGGSKIDFVVIATDANTGRPVPNASACFSDGNEQFVRFRTDGEGMAEVRYHCFTWGTTTPVCDTGCAGFDGITLTLIADGYADFQAPLHRLAGHTWPLHGPAPPPLGIRLTPMR